MMNTDSIRERIISDAQAAAVAMLQDADSRAQDARLTSEQKIAAMREKSIADTGSQCDELRDRMLRMAELDQRKALLKTKRDGINAAFDAAIDKLRAMDLTTARAFLKRILLENAQGAESIVIDKADEKVYTEQFIADVNSALAANGRPGKLVLDAERRAIGGGFLLKAGGAEINCTYEALLREARPKLENEVARMLFPSA